MLLNCLKNFFGLFSGKLNSRNQVQIGELRLRIEDTWVKAFSSKSDLTSFRSHNHFVWQEDKYFYDSYSNSFFYARTLDKLDVHNRSTENGSYGARVFNVANMIVSRDLIDSMLELNFLARNISQQKIQNFVYLDIGAGYGRLGKRILDTLPGATYLATDALDESLSICRHYLSDYLNEKRGQIFSLNELDNLSTKKIDIAMNIHSFSEMTIEFVEFWVQFIANLAIPYLFVVPNNGRLSLNDGSDFSQIITSNGYRLIAHESKYPMNESGKLWLYPDEYYLFSLDN
jgi:putative sugar O-methyltransferase